MRAQPEPNQMGSNRVEGNVRIEMTPAWAVVSLKYMLVTGYLGLVPSGRYGSR